MFFYRFLSILFSPLILNHLLWKSVKLKQSRFLLQRLGFDLNHIPQHCLWLHCASVGETQTVLALIYELRKRNPSQNFLITTNTTTGAEIVAKQQQDWLFHAYLPMDWVNTTKRFIACTQPTALYLIETELWPNLIDSCYKNNIPVTIINGRLSKKTISTNRWVKSVYKRILNLVEKIYVRSDTDRKRYIQLGAEENKTLILGNLKFIPPNTENIQKQKSTTREYVVVASSHDGEELEIAKCWNQLDRKELLVVAPRHPERREKIVKQLANNTLALRSRNEAITNNTEIYLLDTVGELTNWYNDAKLIIMAGSFMHRGGHNLLEPAHFGKAIVFGPHMESFEDEVNILLANDAAIQVDSINELKTMLAILLDDAARREQLQNNSIKTVAPFVNILSDYVKVIEENNNH